MRPSKTQANATAARTRAERAQGGRLGFFLSGLGYLGLALRQPSEWTVPVWAILAFLVVPGIAGVAAGRKQGRETDPVRRFQTAFRAVAWTMALYTGTNLFVLRRRFRPAENTLQLILLWLLVTVFYAIIAGCAAGLAAAFLAGRKQEAT